MYEVTVQANFSAAHRLKDYPGQCGGLHGHNWRVSVTLGAKRLDKQGMIIDFRVLKGHLNEVLNKLDHKCLNELSCFKRVNPTSENIARYIYHKMRPRLGLSPRIFKVTVWETDTSRASYDKSG